MCKDKKKYIVDVELRYTDGGMLHRRKHDPHATWAVSKEQAISNVRYRLGRPINPITNYSDEMCEWNLTAKEF